MDTGVLDWAWFPRANGIDRNRIGIFLRRSSTGLALAPDRTTGNEEKSGGSSSYPGEEADHQSVDIGKRLDFAIEKEGILPIPWRNPGAKRDLLSSARNVSGGVEALSLRFGPFPAEDRSLSPTFPGHPPWIPKGVLGIQEGISQGLPGTSSAYHAGIRLDSETRPFHAFRTCARSARLCNTTSQFLVHRRRTDAPVDPGRRWKGACAVHSIGTAQEAEVVEPAGFDTRVTAGGRLGRSDELNPFWSESKRFGIFSVEDWNIRQRYCVCLQFSTETINTCTRGALQNQLWNQREVGA